MSKKSEKIDKYIQEYGEDAVIFALRSLEENRNSEKILTIVCNHGAHHLPEKLMLGDVYIASKGNLNFSDEENVKKEYEIIIKNLSNKLKSEMWSKIYIVPFGHSTLSMQIKLLVYKICAIETVDWFYNSEFGYFPLKMKLRKIVA